MIWISIILLTILKNHVKLLSICLISFLKFSLFYFLYDCVANGYHNWATFYFQCKNRKQLEIYCKISILLHINKISGSKIYIPCFVKVKCCCCCWRLKVWRTKVETRSSKQGKQNKSTCRNIHVLTFRWKRMIIMSASSRSCKSHYHVFLFYAHLWFLSLA